MSKSSLVLNNVKLLCLFNFFIDFRLYNPIAIIYFANQSGSYALGMSVYSTIMITQTIFEIPMGVVSDFVGRRYTMMIGVICMTLSLLFYVSGFGYYSLVIGAILEGLSVTFYSGNNEALLYESLKQEGKEQEFANFSGNADSMFQLALGLSALIGSFLAFYFPLSILFWLTFIPYIASLIVCFSIIEPRIHTEKDKEINNAAMHIFEAFKECYKNKKLRIILTSESISQGIGEAIHYFRPVFIALCWPIWAIGIHRTLAHALGFIGFRLAGRIIDKHSEEKALLISSSSINLLNFVALYLTNFLSPILMSLPSLAYGFERTSIKSMQQKEFSDTQRATMGSIGGMFEGLIFAIAGVFLGWCADTYGIVQALVIALVCMFSSLYLNLCLYKLTNNKS